MLKDFKKALADFRDDADIWAGIITGSGEKGFCAGADIKETLLYLTENRGEFQVPYSPMRKISIWKPLIAAVNGLALGGGLEIMLACDIRIACETAVFGVPKVKLGIITGGEGT